jgi:hypothetical protein
MSKARGVNPGFAGQIGTHVGNHITDGKVAAPTKVIERPAAAGPISVPLGNAVATNVGKGGPGAGRTVMASGSQATHGPVNRGSPPPAGNVFDGWGKR